MLGRILIIDDEPEWRERLAESVRAQGHEVYTAASLESARIQITQIKPDVIVLDMKLRPVGLQGYTLLDELDVLQNGPEVIICSARINEPMQVRDLFRGYDIYDFLHKVSYNEAQFVQSVRDAVESKRRSDENQALAPTTVSVVSDSPGLLSEAELRVLREVPRNWKTNKQIAADIHLSLNTVKTHLRSIYEKLGVQSRAAAVEKARKLGYLSPNSEELE
jgi:DNA-binding NarL/FixJ family response regulator